MLIASWILYGAFFLTDGVEAFSWRGGSRRPDVPKVWEAETTNPSIAVQDKSRLTEVYAVAMQELQDLDFEPLCHRIAARLLVNNCQLLDGKNDATVLIDSGRQIRDFVDSYAASLAICDLERGNFDIPSSCLPFREHSLANIPDSKIPRLHVSPQQIDSCLSGLARSDSAWNTWVSYRHKALRFCEAARADNDKTQSIRLHRKLAEILAKLSEGVEQELEAHLHAFSTRAAETDEKLRQMAPDIDQLKDSLRHIDITLSRDVMPLAQASSNALRHGLDGAQNLQQLLKVLLKTVLENNAEVAASQEMALANIKDRTNNEVAIIMAALATAVESSSSLKKQIEISHLQVTELTDRQEHLDEGLGRLLGITESISSIYESHNERLNQAQQMSYEILQTLENMALSAHDFRGFLNQRSVWTTWLLYVICPAASLLMGSYGLPPSAIRNLGLIAIGEVAGLALSYTSYFTPNNLGNLRSATSPVNDDNTTLDFASV
ncbi:hypothetical protein CCHL11_06264 [Colletotrichum chlorophyti]|uniref:Nuclear membrane fusion protein Kar5 n=1 Tax=Colletotrichum chlorophyti TaxID=708187 RepID=A0A1Q8RLE9_9PEZI|nr:hypothetical protein CCHL11_06264 [Colletotrichum chlorophyti]